MLALLAACLWLAGCSGDGPDGGSGNLNIVFDCSMPLQVVAGETCEVGYTLEGASENARVRVVAPDGYWVDVIETNHWSGKIVIYLPDTATDERIVVILSDEGNETVSRYIDLEVKAKSDVVFDLSANSYLIEVIGDNCLIGMGATVLDNAVVASGCIVAANALVLSGSKLEPNSVYAGIPAKKVKEITPEQRDEIVLRTARDYQLYASWFKEE